MNYSDFGVTCAEELEQDEWSLSRPTFETPKGGVLVVVGIGGRRTSHKLYLLKCSLCGKDKELYGQGLFTASKEHLLRGTLPCGCSQRVVHNEDQYKTLVARECIKKCITFHGFYEEFCGNRTKLKLSCKEGHLFNPTISNFLRGTSCGVCGKMAAAHKRRRGDKGLKKEIASKLADTVSFVKFADFSGVGASRKRRVVLSCSKHGDFETSVGSVLLGSGCTKCGRDRARESSCKSGAFYEAEAKRNAAEKGLEVIGIADHSGHRSVFLVRCKHGVFPASFRGLRHWGSSCKECKTEKLRTSAHKTSDYKIVHNSIFACERIGLSFLKVCERTQNIRDQKVLVFCPMHGEMEVNYFNLHRLCTGCPLCAGKNQQQAYVHQVRDRDIPVALKLGIAKDWARRLRHLNNKNLFQMENLGVWEFDTVNSCKTAERECKQTLNTGVLSAREMKDGWTETVSVLDLEKVISIYEKHGGKRIK